LGEDFNNSRIRIEVVCNDSVLDGIIEKSKQVSPDMALIGRKAKHSERGLLVGDIAHALLKKSAFPILIIPKDLTGVPIETMLYATDFGEASISAIKNLVPLAKSVNAKIHIVHIATQMRNSRKDQIKWFKEKLMKQVHYDNIEIKVILSNHIEEELKIYSEHIKADILALLYKEEQGFFQNLFNKSLVKKLDTQIGIPLMGINAAI
jgi:nucleotide-binding universal stress UspA family protein